MRNLNILIFSVFLIFCSKQVQAKNDRSRSEDLYLIENRGQIKDQFGCARNDIQFAIQAPGMAIFVGNCQLHYQFSRNDIKDESLPCNATRANIQREPGAYSQPQCTITSCRLDVELLGANEHITVACGAPELYHENYYLRGCPANGICAQSYKKVTYKNVYPDIDWVVCIKGDRLEHEFVVGPNGDPSNIRLKYSGQNSLKLNDDGSISAAMPMGVLTECAPVCYGPDGKMIRSMFRLEDSILTYNVYDHKGALVIDPVVEWGTYYGPSTDFGTFADLACDKFADIYACGYTYCDVTGLIATTGSFQDAYGGNRDAMLVKFDSSGRRLWATYYGGSQPETGMGVAVDPTGNVYLTGSTSSADSISTPGTQQPVYGGGTNGFLAKFDATGSRLWATYIGGDQVTVMGSVSCDTTGHVYVSGVTEDTYNIASPGSFSSVQSGSRDCFLIKYDFTGQRVWGTYYGGTDDDFGGVNCNDGLNVYLNGWTFSKTNIATPSAHQSSPGGGSDAFLVKFDSSGKRIWGTYDGGSGQEITGAIAYQSGSIYLFGSTQSDTGISTPGAFQSIRGGMEDAFLVQFDTAGARQWGTYYGGAGSETIDQSRIATDDSVNVYVTGYTTSTSGIASPGAWKANYSGTTDNAFLAKFNKKGAREWSTYFGGTGSDEAAGCAFDGTGIYISGRTSSTDSIATPGSFVPTGGGGLGTYQGFLAKFIYEYPALQWSANAGSAAAIHIYPVPNDGVFTLTGTFKNSAVSVQILITDMTGRIVMADEASVINGMINKQIDMKKDAPAGNYLVKVVSNEQVNVLKFVKE